jgi:hypothetical protein
LNRLDQYIIQSGRIRPTAAAPNRITAPGAGITRANGSHRTIAVNADGSSAAAQMALAPV